MFTSLGKRILSILILAIIISVPLNIILAQSTTPGTEEFVGYLSHLHGDPQNRPGNTPRMRNILFNEKNQAFELIMDAHQGMALNGKRVKIHGKRLVRPASGPSSTEVSVESVEVVSAAGTTAPSSGVVSAAAVTGSRPWVTIACRFADSTGTTPRPITYFDGLTSSTYPGINHYWQQQSYGQANINGTITVSSWLNLPSPRSAYLKADGSADLGKLATDCTAAADSQVNFPTYTGINLMFNQDLDCCAWGGSRYMTLDGVSKSYSMTWMPPWGYNSQSVIGHEMGHGFGLPHSSGNYGQVYDSDWDVMSGGGTCAVRDATYGCLGVATISYHRDKLGWIGARKFLSARNTQSTITIERLELPVSTTNYLMAQINIPNTSTFYTVEARLKAGYDQNLPGEGIILHKVDPALREPAHVVDPDNNGNPNDAGAVWVPGETFTDSANQISVAVLSKGTSSFIVSITNGSVTSTPTNTPVAPTNTAVPPTKTNTPVPTVVVPTNTSVPPTATNTVVPPTVVPPTFTPIPPTATNTSVPPTVVPPTVVPPTSTTVPPTKTNTPAPPTATRTFTPTVAVTNVALNKVANASSTCASTETAAKAFDGTVANNSKWCGFLSGGAVWVRVDLGVVRTVRSFTIRHAGAGGESTSWNTKAFQIQYSADGSTNWITLVNVTANTLSVSSHSITPVSARYIRLYVTQPEQSVFTNAARIYEFEVYGN